MSWKKRWLGLALTWILLLSGCDGTPSVNTEPTDPKPVQNTGRQIVCVEYSRFSGAFPEDGSGRQVQDVAAMLIRNDSGKFLDHALVTCQIGEGTGTFKITGLPAGECLWVLEQNAMTVKEGEKFTATDCTEPVFRSDAVEQTDQLSVVTDGNTVTVTNVSDKTLENVCIYYKTVFSDGNYFGGITYMLGFDTLGPGQQAQRQSGHFGEESHIVRYSYQIQQSR